MVAWLKSVRTENACTTTCHVCITVMEIINCNMRILWVFFSNIIIKWMRQRSCTLSVVFKALQSCSTSFEFVIVFHKKITFIINTHNFQKETKQCVWCIQYVSCQFVIYLVSSRYFDFQWSCSLKDFPAIWLVLYLDFWGCYFQDKTHCFHSGFFHLSCISRDLSRLYAVLNIGPFPKANGTEHSQFFGYKFLNYIFKLCLFW